MLINFTGAAGGDVCINPAHIRCVYDDDDRTCTTICLGAGVLVYVKETPLSVRNKVNRCEQDRYSKKGD